MEQVGAGEMGTTIDQPERPAHSHSIVPGGFLVMSYATRFTPRTSLTIRPAVARAAPPEAVPNPPSSRRRW